MIPDAVQSRRKHGEDEIDRHGTAIVLANQVAESNGCATKSSRFDRRLRTPIEGLEAFEELFHRKCGLHELATAVSHPICQLGVPG
jgi:hypothetical protein